MAMGGAAACLSAIEPLMAELSEDPGSAKSGESYDVTPDAPMEMP